MTTQTTPETAANDQQTHDQEPEQDMSLEAILARLIHNTDRMSEEIEKLKAMI